ncbi:MAG: Gldg family protein [Chitinophagaceae bacterium]|nr:Gldg family protein [Chitinophagaceae bacterium]
MKKIVTTTYGWIVLLAVLIAVNMLAGLFKFRLDLTAEQRYSLSPQTKKLLRNIDSTITIDVFLKGDFRSSFRKLKNSTDDLLVEMKEYSSNNLVINYKTVEELFDEDAKANMLSNVLNQLKYSGVNIDSIRQKRPNFNEEITQQIISDSLKVLGIMPYTLEVQEKEESKTQRVIYPSAVVHYGNKVIPVDLLSGKTEYSRDPLTGRLATDEAKSISNAEALLEFKFANAIEKFSVNKSRSLVI